MNEFRDVFKKERDKEVKETRENRVNKTDRSDLESIVQMIFNRFKAIKEENYESTRFRMKSQALNKDSITKTYKFEKKTDKNLNSFETRTKSKNELSQHKDSKSSIK